MLESVGIEEIFYVKCHESNEKSREYEGKWEKNQESQKQKLDNFWYHIETDIGKNVDW